MKEKGENNNEEFIIRKVHIQSLVDTLLNLWHQGVEYVDLRGEFSEIEDSVYLGFDKDYMDPEYIDNYEDIIVEVENNSDGEIKSRKLSDEDLNQLT